MFQKFYKNKGMILVDVILAFSVGGLFAVIIVQSSIEARSLFERSRERKILLDVYEDHVHEFADMMPYELRKISVNIGSSTIDIIGNAKWYGNERIETVITLDNKLTIESIRPHVLENSKMKSVPLCSIDISVSNGISEKISITPITLPIDLLLPLTDIEVRNNIAYISADSTRAIDPDILIFDIASTTDPRLLNSINIGPGITSIVFVENKIFAAANSTAAQLHIIGIDGLYSMSLLGKYTLGLPSTTTPPTVGSSISYYDSHIFLGTAKWDGAEFNIFKIADNSSAIFQSGLEVGSKVTDIFSIRDRAYITSSAVDQLILVDITDRTNPIKLNTFSHSGWLRQEGKVISYFEDLLTLGRTSGGFDIKTDYELFYGSATSTPDELDFPDHYNMLGGVYGVVMNRSRIFVASREAGKELQVFGHSISDGHIETYSLPVAPQRLVCDNDHLYVLAASAPVVYEISFK